MKNKSKNPYATLSIKKITAPKSPAVRPAAKKTVGGDLRVKGGR